MQLSQPGPCSCTHYLASAGSAAGVAPPSITLSGSCAAGGCDAVLGGASSPPRSTYASSGRPGQGEGAVQ